jgi:cytidylate kinase
MTASPAPVSIDQRQAHATGLRRPVQVRVVGIVHERAHQGGPDAMTRQFIITIDGPAATGKTSVAHALAKRLGFEFLDTGAMYRAASLIALDAGLVVPSQPIDASRHASIVAAVERVDMVFDWRTDPPVLMCDARPVMRRIRDDDVTGVVSPVSGIMALRQIMVAKQRRIADDHPRLVTEGRDQGAVVFPEAPVKFFLDADPVVRARRRRDQMVDRRNRLGVTEPVQSIESIAEGLLERDAADAAEGRLLRPSDAIIIDTTNLDFQQVVDALVQHVRRELGPALA